jgi:hypothetical protein
MQHQILVDQFERHLAGNASEEFHNHLRVCDECRREVAAMQEISQVVSTAFTVDSAESPVPPMAGFYNRVSGRIVEQQRSQFWWQFSPGVAFFRRVAFASLLFLAGLGSFLVSREAAEGGTDAAAIMAQHDASAVHAASSDRDQLLVTLASYRE